MTYLPAIICLIIGVGLLALVAWFTCGSSDATYVLRLRDGYHGPDPKTHTAAVVQDPRLAYTFPRLELRGMSYGTPVPFEVAVEDYLRQRPNTNPPPTTPRPSSQPAQPRRKV